MTRKLAVTVFVMSLALVGCGSSSTTKVDAGKPAPNAGVKLDAVNLQPDTGSVPRGDAGVADVVPVPDSGAPTDAVSLATDGGTDTASTDAGPAKLDGGADVQSLPPDAQTLARTPLQKTS